MPSAQMRAPLVADDGMGSAHSRLHQETLSAAQDKHGVMAVHNEECTWTHAGCDCISKTNLGNTDCCHFAIKQLVLSTTRTTYTMTECILLCDLFCMVWESALPLLATATLRQVCAPVCKKQNN